MTRDERSASQSSPVFLDTEFTALTQTGALITLALVSADGAELYAEVSDVDLSSADPWVLEHVIPNTRWLSQKGAAPLVGMEDQTEGRTRLLYAPRERLVQPITEWLSLRAPVEIWGDCLAYDWMHLCELFGGARHLPAGVFYMPFDLATLLRLRGLDPDTDRRRLCGLAADATPHNALEDARVLAACWRRLVKDPE